VNGKFPSALEHPTANAYLYMIIIMSVLIFILFRFPGKPISEAESTDKGDGELGSGEIQQQSWFHRKK
jgi:hypothetical protein